MRVPSPRCRGRVSLCLDEATHAAATCISTLGFLRRLLFGVRSRDGPLSTPEARLPPGLGGHKQCRLRSRSPRHRHGCLQAPDARHCSDPILSSFCSSPMARLSPGITAFAGQLPEFVPVAPLPRCQLNIVSLDTAPPYPYFVLSPLGRLM